jgi:hypothetical protein
VSAPVSGAPYRYCGRHAWPLPCPECTRQAERADLLAQLVALKATVARQERVAHVNGC